MIENRISFFSEGHRLQGSLYCPDVRPADVTCPALVINSGYQGFNSFYPRMFASRLTEFGYVCLGFDYRGMADSQGEKGRVIIEEQAQDVRNAVTFLGAQPGIDPHPVGLIGWGMGAANVILAAASSDRVFGVAALNGFYNGWRWLQSIYTYNEYLAILDQVSRDRVRRVLHGESTLADTFAYYRLDPDTDGYVQSELASVHGFGHQTQVQFAESILDVDVEQIVPRLAPTPLFIAHGRRNLLHPYPEAAALYQAARGPKTLYDIDGKHNDFMYRDHPEFLMLCDELRLFFDAAWARAKDRPRRITG